MEVGAGYASEEDLQAGEASKKVLAEAHHRHWEGVPRAGVGEARRTVRAVVAVLTNVLNSSSTL